jgi:hypothetical protein
MKLLLYEATGDERYAGEIIDFVDYVVNSIQTTPGGLLFLNWWGTCPHASRAALQLLMVRT